MNPTKIEYCDYTLNPITGCLKGCYYCYAYKIAKRFPKAFPDGFQPTFHPKRLNEPYILKKPSKILLCSMGDMFGNWVPDRWISTILEMVVQNPQHIFMVLTKCPDELWKWNSYFRDLRNLWVGISIDGLRHEAHYDDLLKLKDTKAHIKIISLEPLLRPIYFQLKGVDWIIIGGQTGPRVIPRREWLRDILRQAELYGISVFIKDNASWPERVRFYPYQSQWKAQWDMEKIPGEIWR